MYFGETKRMEVEEGYRWLTTRGSTGPNETIRTNRPVYLWPDRTVITQKQAITLLGGKCIFIFTSTLRMNCRLVEGKLQEYIGDFSLGERLHRAVSAGSYQQPDAVGDLYKVFVTYFPITRSRWLEEDDDGDLDYFIGINGYKILINV